MVVAIGSDHLGYRLKGAIIKHVVGRGAKARDFGADSESSVDYVPFAEAVAVAVASGECVFGILVCGTGVGMSIAANKVRGIRAALCADAYTARMSRRHNDANVLVIGAEVVGEGLALEVVDCWLGEAFEGGRHQRRVDLISALEGRQTHGKPMANP